MRGVRATAGRRHAVVSAAGAALLLALTLPADATAPPPPGPSAGTAGTAGGRARAEAAEATADGVRPAVRRSPAQKVTATYACMGRRSTVTLRARRTGGRVEITLAAPGLSSPLALPAGDVDVTLRLTAHRRGHRSTVAFTGTNPTVRKGGPLRAGPLRAKVAHGARLDSLRGGGAALELRRGLLGVRCTALTDQRPGPFRF